MGIGLHIRDRARAALAPVLCAASIAYLGYHAIAGERGIVAYARLQGQIAENRAALAEIAAARQKLEHRLDLLRPDGLDGDLLEELARQVLGLAHRDDVIILIRPR